MTEIDPRALRDAFGSFMTGVTVVTTRDAQGSPVGFTANSFASVSLDPPLLLVCPGKFLSSYAAFAECEHFAVSILGEGQEEVSNTFASYKGDRFSKVPHTLDLNAVPLIDGAIAQFSCKTHQSVPAGDHQILIGEVQSFAHCTERGLGYVGGNYFSLGLERAALESTVSRVVCGAIIRQGDAVLLEHTQDGYRPPQTVCPDRGRLRQDLILALGARGAAASLGPAYSVFDDLQNRTHYAYFLASGSSDTSGELAAVDLSDLPSLSYTTPAVGEMMSRFAAEARTGNFALYLGDTERGDVHRLNERT